MAGRRPRWLERLRSTFGRPARSEPTPSGHPNAPPASHGAVEQLPGAAERPRDARPAPDRASERTASSPAPAPDEQVGVADDRGATSREADDVRTTPTAAEDLPVADRRDDAPSVRVHEDRLGRRVDPLALSPTEALRLAREGRGSLVRRELPPDAPSGGEDADA